MVSSLHNKKINKIQQQLQKQHLDYISICLTLSIILILSIISRHNRTQIFQLIKNPVVISFILVICLVIGYYHFLSSMLILTLLVFMFIQDNYYLCLQNSKNDNKNNNIREGFVSKERMEELNKIDSKDGLKVSDTKIKELFKPGFFGKRLEEARQKNKDLYESTIAKNKALMALEKKKQRLNRNQKAKSQRNNNLEDDLNGEFNNNIEDLEETFADNLDNTNNGKTSSKEILKRKFDPTNEEDSNLLLTMEACAEINDRIKYNYENKEYLKRYIRDKLEEIIELLNLIDE